MTEAEGHPRFGLVTRTLARGALLRFVRAAKVAGGGRLVRWGAIGDGTRSPPERLPPGMKPRGAAIVRRAAGGTRRALLRVRYSVCYFISASL